MKKERILELKVYKRRCKLKKKRQKPRKKALAGVFQRINIKVQTNLLSFFRKKGFINKDYISNRVIVPKIFSFEENSDDCITFFKCIMSSYLLTDKTTLVDFNICERIDITNAMLLKIIVRELTETKLRYNDRFYNPTDKEIKYLKSKCNKVNRSLFALKLVDNIGKKEIEDVQPEEGFLYLGLQTNLASKTSYKENKKGAVCTKVREFINESLAQSDAILNARGIHKIDRLLSEIFNNAEDHSIHNEWYVDGVSFKNIIDGEPIIELNLGILNFGFSISEGIINNEKRNKEMMTNIKKWYDKHSELKEQIGSKLNKDDLYTLYSLQDGVSRLKYEDESRGHGTMNFIRAFITLGSFGKENPDYKPHLNIISGKTCVHCDNDVEPYCENNNYLLSLNKEKDISLLPEENYLRHMQEYFPGTFLEVKIYLNKKYFSKALNKKENETNKINQSA